MLLRPRAAVGRHRGVRSTSHFQGTFGSPSRRVRPVRGVAHSYSPGYSQPSTTSLDQCSASERRYIRSKWRRSLGLFGPKKRQNRALQRGFSLSGALQEGLFTGSRVLNEVVLEGAFLEVGLSLLLLRVCGLFFLDYLQALDHLEGEAHYAAVLALVLKVDGFVVVVDEDLRHEPAAVVEPLGPLGDILVRYLFGLLAHRHALLSL